MRTPVVLQTIEVDIDATGRIRPLDYASPIPAGRALLTFLPPAIDEILGLAEPALAVDWLRPEEDAAWSHLQPDT
jgi:hypothetical protein